MANVGGSANPDLSYSFASAGAGYGLGLPIVRKLLGHTQASTTQRYAHIVVDPLRKAQTKLVGELQKH